MYGRNRGQGQFGGNVNQGAFIARPGNFGAAPAMPPAVPPPGGNGNFGPLVTKGGQVCYDPAQYVQACMDELLATSGNAGIPGCGLTGDVCNYQLLGAVIRDVAPDSAYTIEIQALRAVAFKPRFIYVFGIGSTPATSGTNVRFDITNVTIGGNPQLINFTGASPGADYAVLSDSYNRMDHPCAVSWAAFGTTNGNSLTISGRNLGDIEADLYFQIWGDAANCNTGMPTFG